MHNLFKKIVRFLWLVGLSSCLAMADENSLSIDEALTLAINHPTIETKRNEYKGAFERLEGSKWHRFPSVSVMSSAGQSSPLKNSSEVVTTLRVEQPLWTGGRITGTIDLAKAKLGASESAINEVEQDVLIKTSYAFFNILKLQSKIETSKESILEHQRLLELIERKSRAEISPMNEIIFAKARLDQAKTENIQLQTLLSNSRADLESYTSKSIKGLKVPRISLAMPNDLDSAIKEAINYSPTLKRLAFESKAAEADIDVAKSGLWPQLSARSDEIFGGVVPGNTTYLALTYTPGNGLSSLSATREAATKKEVVESNIKSIQLEIGNKIRSDWNEYQSNLRQAEVQTNLAETTRGVYESYVRQYDAGKKTWVEVLNAKKEATQAKYNLADCEWNSYIAGLRLQIYTGLLTAASTPTK